MEQKKNLDKNINTCVLPAKDLRNGMHRVDEGWQLSYYSDALSLELQLFTGKTPEKSVAVTVGQEYRKGRIFRFIIPKEYSGKAFRIDGKNYEDSLCYTNLSTVWEKKPILDRFGVDPDTVVSCMPEWEQEESCDEGIIRDSGDVCIYKVHVRGFSRKNGRGLFNELAEKTGYIKELGMNTVLLMPAYEFHEFQKKKSENLYHAPDNGMINYWGYSGAYYYAPKAAYSDKNPIAEFKSLVSKFHSENIAVFMEFYFEWGVSVNKAVDVIKYWKNEYHIDGVRLICNDHIMCSICQCEELAELAIIGDHFPDGDIAYDTSFLTRKDRFIIYDSGFMWAARHYLRADDDSLSNFLGAMTRKINGHPVINYISDNDGMTLADIFSYERRHNEENCENNRDGVRNNVSINCGIEGPTDDKAVCKLRNNLIKSALSMLFLSSGVPLLMAGDEFGRTQNGNNNPYCQDNATSYLDWSFYKKNYELYEYTRKLISFRKKHKCIRPEREFSFTDHDLKGLPDISYHGENAWYPDFECSSKNVGVLYCGAYSGSDSNIYVLYNMSSAKQKVAVPALTGNWSVYIESSKASCEIAPDGKSYVLSPKSVIVLETEKEK